ncbi:protein NCBP2AS2-like [Salminus brasiliensis]|uniref:protein NCBP2AS2-like n=1 Tax=Salminus brasiliensis TaxID=930266 RepID=UPI003B834D95
MVLQRLLFALINKAQLIERLAESRAIRRAAQLTAFAITKGQLLGKEASARLLDSNTARHLREEARKRPQSAADAAQAASRLRDTFVKEVKEGMREASRQIKDRK